jgi:hypothetical protein
MLNRIRRVLLLAGAVIFMAHCFGGSALATRYAGEPFSLGLGARALGRGGAYVAAPGDAASNFWNPAALAGITSSHLIAMHAETFGSLINHDVVAYAWPGREGSRFALGVMLYYLGGGGVAVTALDSLTNRPYVLETRDHADYLAGVSLARRAGASWSWGITGKFIYRNIVSESAYGLGLDAAVRWQPTSMVSVGVKAADFTGTYLSYNTGTTETIMPHLTWGGQLDYPYRAWIFTCAAEAETFFENRRGGSQVYAGSVSADFHLGLEAGYRNLFFGRFGSDVGHFTAGAGVRLWRWDLDLAFLDHEKLDNSYRVSLGYRF